MNTNPFDRSVISCYGFVVLIFFFRSEGGDSSPWILWLHTCWQYVCTCDVCRCTGVSWVTSSTVLESSCQLAVPRRYTALSQTPTHRTPLLSELARLPSVPSVCF